jgi:hypothetical protein
MGEWDEDEAEQMGAQAALYKPRRLFLNDSLSKRDLSMLWSRVGWRS